MQHSLPLALYLIISSIATAAELPLPSKISFNRDIRPIMSDTCFHCHGFDPKTREAGLRLDQREAAISKTEEGTIGIIPGKPEESSIIQRIMDNDDPMPPEKAHKPLTDRQKALFKQWVAEGAVYEPHWAYAPLTKPTPPANAQHPIDAFIQAKLAEKNIPPSTITSKEKLHRRLSLDLTGLPPPKDATAKDTSAYITELLASAHYGERMAVWWLDIVNFSDTVGFHGDQNQRIFPYRDYVINAFNSNKGFDQFTIEQLAGDLLPNPTDEQLTATGFNRLNMMTREGGAQPKEYLAKYGAQRVRTVGTAWFGSTFGCAECHDHKFDPIKTRDFYELQSFFADVKQWGVYADYGYSPNPELEGFNNEYPFPPERLVSSPYIKKRADAATKKLQEFLSIQLANTAKDPKHQPQFQAWLKQTATYLKQHPTGWTSPKPEAQFISTKGKPNPKRLITLHPDLAFKSAQPLAKNEALDLSFEKVDTPSISSIRVDLATEHITAEEWQELYKRSIVLQARVVKAKAKDRKLEISHANATHEQTNYNASTPLLHFTEKWLLPQLSSGTQAHAVWVLKEPLRLQPGEKLVIRLISDQLVALRLSFSPLAAPEATKSTTKAQLADLAAEQSTALSQTAWLYADLSLAPQRNQLQQLTDQALSFHDGKTWTMITESTPSPLTVKVLPRGNWQDETGTVVQPSTPSFLPARLESSQQKRLSRLDLAQWITSAQNPITARAVMNRLWQQFFGTGLSAVVDDLGSQGELPSHPELLDWLASEFRDSGWDVKHMVRLIVTSHTYQQSSSLRPELKDSDPANRLLASQNPRRLDAEFVRDNALFIANALNLEDIGGPSVKPYQPADYYASLQYPDRVYQADTNEQQYRRGVYMHWQRTFLHPMLANFDAPARDECAAARTSSNTPQQALTLLNDPSFVEAARLFASRLIREAKTDTERLQLAFNLALLRPIKAEEQTALTSFLTAQTQHYQAHAEDADKLLKIGNTKNYNKDTISLAAWTQVCRVILNAQETITRY
jgi:hypothetical protein